MKADNARLAYDNARLRETVHRQAQYEVENRELKRLLQLRETTPGDAISAQVVGKDFTEFFRVTRVVLDRGSRDVRPHMGVVSPDGVVGAVLHVAGDSVDVRLSVDAAFVIDVEDERTKARGFVRGTGDPTRYACKVENVDSEAIVETGDLLVTSGKGKWFPRGIPVARISKIVKRELGRDQDLEAVPTVDFSRLDAVLILVSPPADESPGEPSRRHALAHRVERQAVRNTSFFAAGLALLLIQANLFRVTDWTHIPGLVPSLVMPLILFMGVHEYSVVRGASVSFVLGYATDLIGIAPIGLYTFIYVAIFLLARIAGVRLAAQTTMMQVALALAFALVHSIMILVLLAIFGRDPYVPRALWRLILPHVLATGAMAPLVFRLAERMHAATVTGSPPRTPRRRPTRDRLE